MPALQSGGSQPFGCRPAQEQWPPLKQRSPSRQSKESAVEVLARSLSLPPLCDRRAAGGFFEFFDAVGFFPGECITLSAEVAVAGGLGENGAAEVEVVEQSVRDGNHEQLEPRPG